MSASAPERDGLNGDQVKFIADILGQNARWSASIHNAALDGQERASNEWAQRYLNLVSRLEGIVLTAGKWDRGTELFERLGNVLDAQGFYPDLASDQLEAYRERLAREAVEEEEAAA